MGLADYPPLETVSQGANSCLTFRNITELGDNSFEIHPPYSVTDLKREKQDLSDQQPFTALGISDKLNLPNLLVQADRYSRSYDRGTIRSTASSAGLDYHTRPGVFGLQPQKWWSEQQIPIEAKLTVWPQVPKTNCPSTDMHSGERPRTISGQMGMLTPASHWDAGSNVKQHEDNLQSSSFGQEMEWELVDRARQ